MAWSTRLEYAFKSENWSGIAIHLPEEWLPNSGDTGRQPGIQQLRKGGL
jgi:hypothetical protein